MNIDSVAIAAIADELRLSVLGGRVQKVVQAGELAFGIELYANHVRRWLLLSADPERPRVHLAGEKLGRADDRVSPLLLLLRKHLKRARLTSVDQPGLERLLALGFGERGIPDDDSDAALAESDETPRASIDGPTGVKLIIETIGRYSNLILVDGESGEILDSAKRVPPELNRYRVILPRRPYVPPPPQDKRDAETVSADVLTGLLSAARPKSTAAQVLVGAISGVSPLLAKEVVFRATGSVDTLAVDVASPSDLLIHLNGILGARGTGGWEPCLALENGRPVEFAPYPLTHCRDTRQSSSISAAIDEYYSSAGRLRPVDQARSLAIKALAPRRLAARKKHDSLLLALEGAGRAERYRQSGDAILTHISSIYRGQQRLIADGLEIDLNPSASASENAQTYYKRYRKAKLALAGVPALLEETRTYLDYLDQGETLIRLADSADQVRAIQRELSGKDRPKKANSGQSRQTRRVSPRNELIGLIRTNTADGLEVLVGRSGRQNEIVTFDLAGPEDVWLHARGVPGAHVILRCGSGQPSDDSLVSAASIAAYYSASREATSVPVDWTRRRHVRKIKSSLPGLVTFTNERTLQVRPSDV